MTANVFDDPFALFNDPQWAAEEQGSAKDIAGFRRARRARPTSPAPDKRPEPALKSRPRRTTGVPPTPAQDPEIHLIKGLIQAADPEGARCGSAIRNALDQAYDGRRTGRWDLSQLTKAESAHIGPLIEVWLQRVLNLDDGITTSLQVAGSDVACTWSERLDGWTLERPVPEQREVPYLVMWANEETSRFSLGILRPGPDSRGVASMDRGRPRLSQVAIDQILWVFDGCALPANVLVKHPETAMLAVSQSSGQKAVNMLFRHLQGELVQHSAVETVAQQIDSSKRVREAREQLRNEGIVIFGHYHPQPEIAAALSLPSPRAGTFVSHRLAPMEAGELGTGVEIDGGRWRLAVPGDPVTMAPALPVQGKERI
ncbi:NaeI family type II restriction endonuclease [Pseudarthrobacter sp. WHRI 8279]|uniref:NaeI family type II restriction endonuclease n=1 Tax=Pseudarthrobacter sp. WHRI 8279 TaxID=3162566 RepID=UPI0032EE2778